MRLLVDRVTWEAEDVVSVRLRGADLPAWTPGAHLEVVLPSGLIRQYSLCGDPADRTSYLVAVLRERAGRGGSAEIHDSALVGRALEVRGPRNHFALEPAPAYVFVAGGIGVTPLVAMARAAAGSGTPWRLHYGGRSRGSMAFVAELGRLSGGEVVYAPQDEVGLLDLDAIVAGAPPGAAIYACGPEGMLRAAQAAGDAVGRTVTVERFASSGNAVRGTSGAFEVDLRRSGLRLAVPADRSMLEVIRDVLPDVPYSCEEGYCGTCEVRVIDGAPEHRDDILSPDQRAAGDLVMICVSRSASPVLSLDL
ncbi:ferredoxin-NADP reductase [Asanoa ferruginea]|uniref:Ferredoxin-NADP reductase n=1 Tax=Asanoa ferruginea TaxID=53367 RepID=A0A3D9ZT71_9ACTN|nr:PDR/VanB family oxidoreductase [Asanoa ferruginea]REF99193.1 ferredoxin-NADP reductase [Asanoa ferruginea]GIF45784.1 iron-sulfur protein [Asanoa ferruginea]